MNKRAKYCRVKNRIYEVDDEGFLVATGVLQFDSIGAAKRASRDIQMREDGALGLGSVTTVDVRFRPDVEAH